MKRRPLEALFAGSGGVAFPRMTALVGAGGKTTLMYALARRMADAGRRVVCTTTTKIFPPENGLPVVLLEGVADPVAAVHDALFAAPCVVAAGRPLPDVRKLDGVSPVCLACCRRRCPMPFFLWRPTALPVSPSRLPLHTSQSCLSLWTVAWRWSVWTAWGSRWTTGMCTVPHWFARRRGRSRGVR